MRIIANFFTGCLLLLLFGRVNIAKAQEIYFSISGKNVVIATGDASGELNIWIKPKEDSVDIPRLEIYDAAIGGFSDLTYGTDNTTTNFSLYSFEKKYTLEGTRIIKRDDDGEDSVIHSITTFTEQRFKNRWVVPFELKESGEQGWILSVEADEGDDVNNFKLRLSGVGADKWDIISLDLSVGLYQSERGQEFQFRPLFNKQLPPAIVVEGEEDSRVEIVDAFGSIYANDGRDKDKWIAEAWGLINHWALTIDGSRERLNNLVVKGRDEIIPWVFAYQFVQSQNPPKALFSTKPIDACNDFQISLESSNFELDISKTLWLVEDKTYSGPVIKHTFSQTGDVAVSAIVPMRGRIVPAYQSLTQNIRINQPPVIQLNEFKKRVSPSETIAISAARSYDPEEQPLTLQWFVNGTLRGTGARFNFSSSVSGNYKVRVVADDKAPSSLCTVAEKEFGIVVNTQPYAEINYAPLFSTFEKVTFTAIDAFDSDKDSLTYRWRISDRFDVFEGDRVDIRHDKEGKYTATLIVSDLTGTQNQEFITTVNYRVNGTPEPEFTLPEKAAPNDIVRLDASGSWDPDKDQLSYTWEISDGRFERGTVWRTTFDQPGIYTITLIADDNLNVKNSSQSLSRNIRINSTPIPVITSVDASNLADVYFSAEESKDEDSDRLRYRWDFGDGRTGNGLEINHQYRKTGTYTVKLTVDDGENLSNSIQSYSKDIIINKNPEAVIRAPEIAAPGIPFDVTGENSSDSDGRIVTYEWYLNGKLVSKNEKPQITIPKPGEHMLTLKVFDDSGFESAYGISNVSVRGNYPPIPKVFSEPNVTAPGVVTYLDATNSIDQDNSLLDYRWEFSDGVSFEGRRIRKTFASPDIYTYRLEVDDKERLQNSVQVYNGEIRVNAPPIIVTESEIISNELTIELDASKSYDVDSKNLALTWVLPDGKSVNAKTLNWKAPSTGVFQIGLIADDLEGLPNSKTSTTVLIRINSPVVAVVDSLIEACTGQIIIFSSARSYDPDGDRFTTTWNFGDGKTSTDNNPYHSYEKLGLYNVTLELNDGISKSSTVAKIPVVIEGSPTARVNIPDTTICINTPITISGAKSSDPNGKIGAYSWDFGDQNTGLGESVTHLYTRPGVYNLVLTVIGSGSGTCSNISQTSVNITVIEGPQAEFSLPEWVDPGKEVILDASESRVTGTLRQAKWEITHLDTKEVIERGGLTSAFTPEKPGTYKVKLTIEVASNSECKISILERFFKVNHAPELKWNTPDHIAEFTPLILSAIGSSDKDGFINRYEWIIDNEPIGNGVTQFVASLSGGKHLIKLRISDNSGVESGKVELFKNITVNRSPDVSFDLPKTVYQGEEVSLLTTSVTDADGDTITYTWFKDGLVFKDTTFMAMKNRYEITLKADDQRSLSNSRDSLTRILNVILAPEFDPILPDIVVLNHAINVKQMQLPKDIYMSTLDGKIINTALFDTIGLTTLNFIWKPDNVILKSYTASVNVLPHLSWKNSDVEKMTVPWNPLNPQLELLASDTNRPNNESVIYEWYKDGSRIAGGPRVSLTLQPGDNRFELRARDQSLPGGKLIIKTYVVNAFMK